MGKRYIDCSARELAAYHKKELLQSIADSEGRVLAAETIGTVTPMLVNITNAEFVTSLGADIIMLNIFDVDHPVINGFIIHIYGIILITVYHLPINPLIFSLQMIQI